MVDFLRLRGEDCKRRPLNGALGVDLKEKGARGHGERE